MVHLLLAVIYLSFISLGLPDSLLGSAWPTMYGELGVPVSYMGVVSIIISVGTVISSLLSDRLVRRLGAGKVTAISVALTALALYGFSVSNSFWLLCLMAIPYGLGAGSVDAALNNYVALHYASRHMSWLHCMWGVGASIGPYIMGYALTGGLGWSAGYSFIAVIQVVLTAILLLSLPLWRGRAAVHPQEETKPSEKPLSIREILRVPGAKEVMTTFFCYCALEQSAGLWAGSYLVLYGGMSPEAAAGNAGLFFIGITVGRAISGFLTFKLRDEQMIRLGQGIIVIGILLLLLPIGSLATLAGFLIVGFGCAPIYPCIMHATPELFGADRSQAIFGVEMASAYIGCCLMPALFGIAANLGLTALLPVYLLGLLVLMVFMYSLLLKKAGKDGTGGKSANKPL